MLKSAASAGATSKKSARQRIVFAISMLFSSAPSAQVLTFADIKAKNAVQLSAEELRQLLPGAKVISITKGGSTRYWENQLDGSVVASSDGRGGAGRNRANSGSGTWRIGDGGTFCIRIDWNRTTDEWCRHVFKVGSVYYGIGQLIDSALANELEFSK
jgi:hypothetical protein